MGPAVGWLTGPKRGQERPQIDEANCCKAIGCVQVVAAGASAVGAKNGLRADHDQQQ